MSRYRVMVVDDDADVRYVVTSLLAMDFETVQASNGLDALEKFERYEPDLLLLDVMMPVMNGIHCCRSVRRREDFGDLPVFFLSASADPKVREDAREAGATDFIEKPFDTAALIDRIRGYLYGERRPPRAKLFTMREIEKIDATPLKAADRDEPDAPEAHPGNITATSEFQPATQEEGDGKRKRRVFGKIRVEPTAGGASQTAIPTNLVPREIPPVQASAPPAAPPPPPAPPQATPLPPPTVFPRRPAPIPPTADPHSLPAPPSPDLQRPTPRPPAAIPPTADPFSLPAPVPSDIFAAPPPPIDPDVFAAQPPPVVPRPPVPVPPTASPESLRPTAPAPGKSRFSEEQRAEAREILAQRAARALGATPGARKPAATLLLPRVLVIIDVPESLPVAHEALKGLAEFLPLEDPVEAVELIARFQPDIVVAGIRTPKYSGLELGRMLQGSVRLAHTQLIFVVGNRTSDADANAARRMSGNELLYMPLKADLMHTAVRNAMSKPGFQVREKALSYGVYVKEVLKAVEAERAKVNKELEKEAFRRKTMGIESFMARELSHLMPQPPASQPPPAPQK